MYNMVLHLRRENFLDLPLTGGGGGVEEGVQSQIIKKNRSKYCFFKY